MTQPAMREKEKDGKTRSENKKKRRDKRAPVTRSSSPLAPRFARVAVVVAAAVPFSSISVSLSLSLSLFGFSQL